MAKTIGIVDVAALAAFTGVLSPATAMTATRRWTAWAVKRGALKAEEPKVEGKPRYGTNKFPDV